MKCVGEISGDDEFILELTFSGYSPLELCTCSTCGTPIMVDDKLNRIRVIVPNLMGYSDDFPEATYHAFYDASTGVPRPNDGREVHEGLRPEFVWPDGS